MRRAKRSFAVRQERAGVCSRLRMMMAGYRAPRRDLVVARLGRNSELEQFSFALEHEGEQPLGNGGEIIILELLSFRWRRSEQRSAGRQQVRPREKEMLVDQEILLLGAGVRDHRSRILVTESFRMRLFRACSERSSGVFLSSASPVHDTKAVGIHRVMPLGFSTI